MRLGATVTSGPVTYVMDGKQYLVVAAGDSLYALGLARLAEEGDLEAVAMLADLITDCAKAHAQGDPGLAEDLWSKASR